MNRRLLDILACPMDKHYPLELYGDDNSDTIQTALLYCTECGRFYVATYPYCSPTIFETEMPK